jgi:hypothetical protein
MPSSKPPSRPKPRRAAAAKAARPAGELVATLRALVLAAATRQLRTDFSTQLAAFGERLVREQTRLIARLERQQRELGARLTRLQHRVTTLARRTDRALHELAEHTAGERIDDHVLAIAESDRVRNEFTAGLRELERRLLAVLDELQAGQTDRQQLAHLLTDVARQVKLPRGA